MSGYSLPFKAGVSTGGNTLGTTGTVLQQVVFAGTNVTLSQSISGQSATVTISGGVGGGGGSVNFSAGTTSNNLTNVVFSDSNGLAFGLNGSTITGSYTVPTVPAQFSGGDTTLGNTLGDTGVVTGRLVLAGGNNITLSGSTNAGSLTITVSAFNQSVQTQGILSAGMSTEGNTSGSTGLADHRLVIVGSNAIILSQSTAAGGSNTLSIINSWSTATTASQVTTANQVGANAGRFALEGHQHAGVPALAASNTGNTAGNTGTQFGTWVMAGTNNITVSESTGGAGVHTLWFSAPNVGAGNITVSAGTSSVALASLVFSNSNNVAFGLNGSTITAAALTMRYWENAVQAALNANAHNQTQLSFQRLVMAQQMTATEIDYIGHMTGSSAAASGAITVSHALYTMAGSTASSVSSGSLAISWTSGSDTSASSQWGGQSGTRFRTASINSWAITPGDYLFGFIVSTATSQTAHTWTFFGGSSLSIGAMAGGGNFTNYFGEGLYTASTAAFPASLHITNINQTGGGGVFRQPWFALAGSI
jgi:hypothetical protein